jgi:hypothetical protein
VEQALRHGDAGRSAIPLDLASIRLRLELPWTVVLDQRRLSNRGTLRFQAETDCAFEWLERVVRATRRLAIVKVDPLLKKIRYDTRYPAFLKTMRLPI